MYSAVILAFFGLLRADAVFCLKKEVDNNCLSGAYFTNVGTYNFADSMDDTFVTSYTLTGLENVLANAQSVKNSEFSADIENLESNLNKIYKVCNQNRANYLPYGTSSIPESLLRVNIKEALNDSYSILSDLVSLSSGTYSDKFGIKEKMSKTQRYSYNYLYPANVKDFEIAKKYLNFTLILEKISDSAAIINVRMAIPVLFKVDLQRVHYVPMLDTRTSTFKFLKDQSISNVAVRHRDSYTYNRDYNTYYYLLRNMDKCVLVNETFLCDPATVTKGDIEYGSCLASLLRADCFWASSWMCRKARDTCLYEESSTKYKEFTYLRNNQFFVLMTRKANYLYKCSDGREERGTLTFRGDGDYRYSGTIEIDDNCSLITAFTSIHNKNGLFEIEEVDNDDLIKADVPKIIGIPVWIFVVSVVVIALIVLMLLVTWICKCIRRYKAKKYANVNGEG